MRSELNLKNNKQHLYDDFLLLDNKMKLKGLGFQHEKNEASIIPIGNVCNFTCFIIP